MTQFDLTLALTQPLLGVIDRDGRVIETAVMMARRLDEMERRLRDSPPRNQNDGAR